MKVRGDRWPDWRDNAFLALVVFTVMVISALVATAVALSLVG